MSDLEIVNNFADRRNVEESTLHLFIWLMLLSVIASIVIAVVVVAVSLVPNPKYSCNSSCEVESEAFIGAIEMVSDLGMVVLVIPSTCGVLDLGDVGVLCDICAPLHHSPRVPNGRDNVL